ALRGSPEPVEPAGARATRPGVAWAKRCSYSPARGANLPTMPVPIRFDALATEAAQLCSAIGPVPPVEATAADVHAQSPEAVHSSFPEGPRDNDRPIRCRAT